MNSSLFFLLLLALGHCQAVHQTIYAFQDTYADSDTFFVSACTVHGTETTMLVGGYGEGYNLHIFTSYAKFRGSDIASSKASCLSNPTLGFFGKYIESNIPFNVSSYTVGNNWEESTMTNAIHYVYPNYVSCPHPPPSQITFLGTAPTVNTTGSGLKWTLSGSAALLTALSSAVSTQSNISVDFLATVFSTIDEIGIYTHENGVNMPFIGVDITC